MGGSDSAARRREEWERRGAGRRDLSGLLQSSTELLNGLGTDDGLPFGPSLHELIHFGHRPIETSDSKAYERSDER